jgi:hypothetical protein
MNNDDDKPFGYAPELPEDIRPVFQDLCQDMASLHSKWQLYLDLFSDRTTIDLLNDMAPAFFQTVEESLRSDITMSICRLSDLPQTLGQDNLSIKTLVDKAAEVRELVNLWNDFHNCCQPVREYRNKRIGHNDLHAILQPHDNPLPNISRATIDSILAKATTLMNHVFSFYKMGEISFNPYPDEKGMGKDLVFWLKRAQEHYQEE